MEHHGEKNVNIVERNNVVVGGEVVKTSVLSQAKKLGKVAEKNEILASNCKNIHNKT